MVKNVAVLLLGLTLIVSAAQAAEKSGLVKGTPDLKSAGPLTFGPNGILFVGDSRSAAIFAIDTGDTKGNPSQVTLSVEGLDQKIAALLGTSPRDVLVNDLAVNPASGNAYLSVSRGRGPQAQPVLLRVDGNGQLSDVSLKNVPFAKSVLPNAPAPNATDRRRRSKRAQSITDLAFVDGRVFIAGLSNEEFESTLRSVPFPFSQADRGTGVGIYHGAHGRFETNSPIRTFTHYKIDNKSYLLAGYTCTPLVKFPVANLKPGAKLQGTTIAELGNRNRPLDMFVYKKGGKNFILMANNNRGVMKITTDRIGTIAAITPETKIDRGGKAGLSYETITDMKGVQQLDRLNQDYAVIIVQAESGASNLQTIALP